MKKFGRLSLLILLISVAYFSLYNFKIWYTRDEDGPVISMEEEELQVSVSDGTDILMQGVTAYDEKDGDVTSTMVIESISGFVDKNTRYINYAAFDENNHVAKASRKLVYTDYEPIRFSISSALRFAVTNSNSKDVLKYVKAYDCIDGDISNQITFSEDSTVDVSTAGDYKVTLMVRNSAGDEAVLPVTITMYTNADELAAPSISLSSYLVYTKVGEPIDPRSYIINQVDELERYRISDNVNYDVPGTYEIQYSLKDDNGHEGKANLVVVVEER